MCLFKHSSDAVAAHFVHLRVVVRLFSLLVLFPIEFCTDCHTARTD